MSPTPIAASSAVLPDLNLPERLSYRVKRRLLGPPLTNDQLKHERLGKFLALGVLAPDCISSSAYGTEQILTALLPYAALGAFTLVLPITGVVIAILVLLTICYRQVVSVYTKAGGSYIVAKENFGPRVAQVAAVALLIDYVVTVAVQIAAGTVAVVSAFPVLGVGPRPVLIDVGMILLLCWGNLRGIKEAGKAFALPTYFFALVAGSMIIVGIIRELMGNLPQIDPTHLQGVHIGHANGFVMGATAMVLLRAFANGGSSLTGLEAISNGVGMFRCPEGQNARKAMLVMACTLGFLVCGVSLLAHFTHATPYADGFPSVISQEARLVFGHGVVGNILFGVMQTATAIILYTGGNTSFNGFPFLASFVADDAFLPRQLRKRGHRLVFSNAIMVLTAVALVLVVATDGKLDALVPLYAIGVFTGFTMAGFGMAKYFRTHGGPGQRRKIALNVAAGTTSLIVVLIFAVVKFSEGAWVVVILFPVLVFALIRLNREYRTEAEVLRDLDSERLSAGTKYSHHTVLVFVDALDLASVEALRYGQSLRPSTLRAVHFVLDSAHADRLSKKWQRAAQIVPLELVDCPDRRLGRATLEMIAREARPRTEVTVLLPRRSYATMLGRLLHDRTADHLARLISRIPNATATIIPYDTNAKITSMQEDRRADLPEPPARPVTAVLADRPTGSTRTAILKYAAPEPPAGAVPIRDLVSGDSCNVQGRVRTVRVGCVGDSPTFVCEIADSTGNLTVQFYGRRTVAGIEPGRLLRVQGRSLQQDAGYVIANPDYQLLTN
ncbi:amino acid permease [Nakamurella panacisegetis]|uniref:amino acid permease n=1 Tax=Nakamurella panacisegetis TaxID=1090615 RepID=UPI000B8A3FF6|nr:amino acid permease [Nakamurella panacisegetis]